jgi:hypothetical protein
MELRYQDVNHIMQGYERWAELDLEQKISSENYSAG